MFKHRKPIGLNNKKSYHKPDAVLVFLSLALVGFGLIFLSSASAVVAYTRYGSSYHFFNRQAVALLLGLFCFWFFHKIDYSFLKKYSLLLLGLSIFFLSMVFIPGLAAGFGTSRSWVKILGFPLQPSEFVKIFFLIYLAGFLESRKKEMSDAKQSFWPFLIVFSIIAGLMLLQPDLGTLFIIAASAFMVYFAAGGKVYHLAGIFLFGVLAFFALAQAKPYQMERFKCVFEKDYDIQGSCYQLEQSRIAVGSGGFWGRGLGQSRQKFLYLPEVHGDSIFAVIAEEVGLIGSLIFVSLYFLLFLRIMIIARRASDLFGRFLAIGIGTWIIVQTFLNIGGVTGLIPMTGVPLPLVSQGGSNLIATLIALGIVLSISRQTVSGRTRF